MRLLSYLFTLFFAFNALAAAPYGIKGQSQSGTLYSNVHQFPNNQVTNLGGINALVETGNKNILINPGFEHSTFSTGWTNSAGTFTEETVLEIDGLKAAKLVLSSQTMSLTQSSTLYASQFDGVQGLAMIRVKSDVALKVCAIQAGVVSTSLCVDVPAHNKWGLFKVPFILGATSNGISIASVGNVTGTVYVDDAFVGAVDLKQDIPTISSQSTRFTAGSTAANGTFSGTPTTSGSGNYTVSSGVFTALRDINISMSCTGTNAAAVAFGANIYVNGAASGQGSTPPSITNYLASTSWTGTLTTGQTIYCGPVVNTASSGQVNVLATNVINTSIYSSTNADTDWASCGHTTSSFTGFGTVTNINTRCKREGGDLLMTGRFTTGTTTAVEARVALMLGGVALTSKGTSAIPALHAVGVAGRAAAQAISFYNTIEPSVAHITFSAQGASSDIFTKLNGSSFGSTETLVINARIPINGWENSNVIIGQFNGLETCADSYQCTDTLSFSVSNTGVVSNENLDTVSGNCTVSDTSLFTCTYRSGLQGNSVNLSGPLNCAVSIDDANSTDSAIAKLINTSSSTQLVFRTGYGSTPPLITKAAYATKIICQKQGVDYIGKTAKAVASDQSVRSIGSVGMDLQSVYFGSGATCNAACATTPCTICNQIGSKITTVSRTAGGTYNINGIDGQKYNCSGTSYNISGAVGAIILHDRGASSASLARVSNPSGVDVGYASVTCIGIP